MTLSLTPGASPLGTTTKTNSGSGMPCRRALVGLDARWASVCIHRGSQRWGKETSDLSRLTHLPRLKGLNVRDTSIRDLSPLAELTDLRQLWIGETPVADLSPLAHLNKLELIYLRNTQVTDVSPLMHLDKLKGLLLDGGAVPPGDIDRLRKALPNCHIVPRGWDERLVPGHYFQAGW